MAPGKLLITHFASPAPVVLQIPICNIIQWTLILSNNDKFGLYKERNYKFAQILVHTPRNCLQILDLIFAEKKGL